MRTELFLHPLVQPIWLLLLVVILEKLWIWPVRYHPLSFFRLLASRMAKKVNPRGHSKGQQMLSGTLAPLVLLAPILVCIGLFIYLAEFPAFFDAFLLLIALSYQPVLNKLDKIQLALMANKKSLARNLAQPLLLRETEQLTLMGLSKAVIEAALLRFYHQYAAVLFWYLLLGGLGAFSYRLLYEFSQVWNVRVADFRYFGAPIARLCHWMQWLPVRFAMLILLMLQKPGKASIQRDSIRTSRTTLLVYSGAALGIQLGGPAFYQGQKIRLPKCGGEREAAPQDINRTKAAIVKTQAVLVLMCLFILTGQWLLRKSL
ncbi:cobalamin biosynthesis protein CobD/CbiB [Bowmanella denitrificans]|uniref:cobalamin biosynthesis protein CobD/CbiB n=1 Tax=Bowmanella denitrificans TaxID=366582 RepID=UPI000C9A6A6B|nr:cobalamin biosynthesis protein [Bowmanella denitrificans]